MPTDVFSPSDWVRAAVSFIKRANGNGQFSGASIVEPPLTEPELRELCRSHELQIPSVIRSFLLQGARSFELTYRWNLNGMPDSLMRLAPWSEDEVAGGGVLCRASSFKAETAECRVWALETWIADEADEQELWLKSLPIMALRNGDYLAVRLDGTPDPEVLYLSHEEGACSVSSSFTEFLQDWSRLYYISPELWVLQNFFDAKSGYLNGNSPQAMGLRELYRQGLLDQTAS